MQTGMRHRQPVDQTGKNHSKSWPCHSKDRFLAKEVLYLASQFSHYHRIVANDCLFFSAAMTRLRKAEVEQGCGRTKPHIPDFEIAQLFGPQ
jgi:hypothetical protein